jgi:hypothetical protein
MLLPNYSKNSSSDLGVRSFLSWINENMYGIRFIADLYGANLDRNFKVSIGIIDTKSGTLLTMLNNSKRQGNERTIEEGVGNTPTALPTSIS